MIIMNVNEAQSNFEKLVDLVSEGCEVVITIAGKPVAKLTAIEKKPKREPGGLKGQIKIAADFDAPLSEYILLEIDDPTI